jgi:hypothetical protein
MLWFMHYAAVPRIESSSKFSTDRDRQERIVVSIGSIFANPIHSIPSAATEPNSYLFVLLMLFLVADGTCIPATGTVFVVEEGKCCDAPFLCCPVGPT